MGLHGFLAVYVFQVCVIQAASMQGNKKKLILTCVEDQFSGRNTDILLGIHQNDKGEPNQYLFKNSCHGLKRKRDIHRLRKFGSSLISQRPVTHMPCDGFLLTDRVSVEISVICPILGISIDLNRDLLIRIEFLSEISVQSI